MHNTQQHLHASTGACECAPLTETNKKVNVHAAIRAPTTYCSTRHTYSASTPPHTRRKQITGACWNEGRRGAAQRAFIAAEMGGSAHIPAACLLFLLRPRCDKEQTITKQRCPQEPTSEMLGILGISPAAAGTTLATANTGKKLDTGTRGTETKGMEKDQHS